VAFSKDGNHVLSPGNPKLIEWDAQSGNLISERDGIGTGAAIVGLDDGALRAVMRVGSSTISLLRPSGMGPDRTLSIPTPAVRVAQSPDGRTLAVASWQGALVSLVDLATGGPQATLAHPEWPWAIAPMLSAMRLALP
jgi:hypothetical protein